MNKVAQCMVKAAQLRAQADKLEKVALLLDGSDKVTGADLGIGAGTLGLLGGGAYGVNKLMKNRAAAKAAAEAAAAAQASKAARNSKLLKGALGLGGIGALGALGAGGYGLRKYYRHYGHSHRWYPNLRLKSFGGYIGAAISGLRLPSNIQKPPWTAVEEAVEEAVEAAVRKKMLLKGTLL